MNKKSLICLITFLGLPFLFKYMPGGLVVHELLFWLLFIAIMLWIYFGEKQTITSIGWKKITLKTIFAGTGLGLVLFIMFGIIMTAVQAVGLELNQDVAKMMANQSIPMLLIVVIRAAVVEEVLYRGYAYERLYDLTQSKWVAALVPVIVFMLAHLSWGVGHLVFVFFGGGLFMLVYIAKRNLALVMVAHFVTDILALLVLPMLVGE